MKTIGVPIPLKSDRQWILLEKLGNVFNVEFELCSLTSKKNYDAWFIYDADRDVINKISSYDQPVYLVPKEELLNPSGQKVAITFYNIEYLPHVLRGRDVSDNADHQLNSLPQWLEDIAILAHKEDLPIWAFKKNNEVVHHYCALRLPGLSSEEELFSVFNHDRCVELLPLVVFLKKLTDQPKWKQPRQFACFMFDDPNLHWPSYGYIDFKNLLNHAIAYKYHVAFAMIPLDAWYFHKGTAELFQRYQSHFSLLVHGISHISRELSNSCAGDDCLRSLNLALERIRSFERRSGLHVDKIMAPPHGACSEEFMEAISIMGFEGATISYGSLRKYNHESDWVKKLGMKPMEMIKGLPIFPRLPISLKSINDIIISAIFNQAVILIGHHQDVSAGFNILEKTAEVINSIPDVKWASLSAISRAQFCHLIDGKNLFVKMNSKRIEVKVPHGIANLWVQTSWDIELRKKNILWKIGNNKWTQYNPHQPILVEPGQKLDIMSAHDTHINLSAHHELINIWAILRRVITEGRDRLMPILKR